MKNIPLLLLVVFLSSCAAIYKPIDSRNFGYSPTSKSTDLSYDYVNSVFSMTGNRRYAKKAFKYGIDVIAVKIQNNTDEVIDVKKSVSFYLGGQEVIPMDAYEITEVLKQRNRGFYLFYALLLLQIETPSTEVTIPIGAGIAAGNIIAAGNSNSNFRANFAQESIMTKRVQPGETIYGLVAFRGVGSGKLDIKLTK